MRRPVKYIIHSSFKRFTGHHSEWNFVLFWVPNHTVMTSLYASHLAIHCSAVKCFTEGITLQSLLYTLYYSKWNSVLYWVPHFHLTTLCSIEKCFTGYHSEWNSVLGRLHFAHNLQYMLYFTVAICVEKIDLLQGLGETRGDGLLAGDLLVKEWQPWRWWW